MENSAVALNGLNVKSEAQKGIEEYPYLVTVQQLQTYNTKSILSSRRESLELHILAPVERPDFAGLHFTIHLVLLSLEAPQNDTMF
jgi:hypothetical protein